MKGYFKKTVCTSKQTPQCTVQLPIWSLTSKMIIRIIIKVWVFKPFFLFLKKSIKKWTYPSGEHTYCTTVWWLSFRIQGCLVFRRLIVKSGNIFLGQQTIKAGYWNQCVQRKFNASSCAQVYTTTDNVAVPTGWNLWKPAQEDVQPSFNTKQQREMKRPVVWQKDSCVRVRKKELYKWKPRIFFKAQSVFTALS